MINITIKTGNSAFEGMDKEYEVARILRELANKYESGYDLSDSVIRDINGNAVGRITDN